VSVGWRTALAIYVCCTVALGTACDSSRHQRESPRTATAAPAAPVISVLSVRPATVAARVAAVGDTSSLAPDRQRAFDASAFEPMPDPGPDDWLAQRSPPSSAGSGSRTKRRGQRHARCGSAKARARELSRETRRGEPL